jgi:hypothetical protein
MDLMHTRAVLAHARLRLFGLLVLALLVTGCGIPELVGGALQNEEYQKKITVYPKYEDLENQTVAIIIATDMATQYEHPNLAAKMCSGISARIARHVPGCSDKVLDPRLVVNWQFRTPQWDALSYGEMADLLKVDRIVYIDIYEYRLHPPGNSWQWEGVCAGKIGVIERDGIDPDIFASQFDVIVEFPGVTGLTASEANAQQVETGLLAEFIKKTAWLFYEHEEPKYPDKYRPHLDPDVQKQRQGKA